MGVSHTRALTALGLSVSAAAAETGTSTARTRPASPALAKLRLKTDQCDRGWRSFARPLSSQPRYAGASRAWSRKCDRFVHTFHLQARLAGAVTAFTRGHNTPAESD